MTSQHGDKPAPNHGLYHKILLAILGVAVLGSTVAIATQSGRGDYAFFDPLIDVQSLVTNQFVDEVDQAELQRGAIQGMIDTLDDPYTVFVPAHDTDDFTKQLTGEYVGIGAEVNLVDGWLTIVSPLDDSPAWKAGVMAGDRVIAIDGETTEDTSIDESIERLTGTPGTPVTVTIERQGEDDPIEITIIRDHIKTRSVRGFHRDAGDEGRWEYEIDPTHGVLYIRLTQFTPQCAAEVRQVIQAHPEHKGIVLDLRFNPGGLLEEAVRIADTFISDGDIVSTRGRAYQPRVEKASAGNTLTDAPLLVLVNAQSASASEVLSGALFDHDRAIVLGERTFGKGSVQTVREIPSLGVDGPVGQIKMTEQRYYLPSGRSIQRKDDSPQWGVDPTPGYYVPMTPDETREMLRVRREEEVLRSEAPADASDASQWSNPEWVAEHLRDTQLAAGLRAIATRIDTGEWVPPADEATSAHTIDLAELQKLGEQRERMLREVERVDRRIEAIANATGEEDAEEVLGELDLWPDDEDLVGGHVTVTDAEGNPVAVLKITGNRLERWLLDADVEPVHEDADEPAQTDTEAEPAGTP